MNKKIIYIKGMHCVSCEMLLEEELKKVSGVVAVRADRKKNIVEIDYEDINPDLKDIEEVVKKYGYEAFLDEPGIIKNTRSKKARWQEWLMAISLIILLFVGYQILLNLGLFDFANLDSKNLTYGVAFLVGLTASLSSCLAVVGSVVIAYSEKYKSQEKSFWGGVAKPNLLFHAGRLLTFFVLGGILGSMGGEINISGQALAIYTIIIAVIMGLLGLNILGIIPSISNMGIKFPRKFTSHWEKIKNSNHQAAPLILGGLTFFLPCGFTQSMQIMALASGSFVSGSFFLFLFALGTTPILLAVGMSTTWTKNRNFGVFQKVAGIIVIVFAIFTFSSGLAIYQVKGDIFAGGEKSQENISENKNEVKGNINKQVIEMHVTARGFEPSVIKIKKGVPVEWVIKGDKITGCTNKIIVPDLNIEKKLSSGNNVVNFTPQKSGIIPFSCWMGMVRGKFIVE